MPAALYNRDILRLAASIPHSAPAGGAAGDASRRARRSAAAGSIVDLVAGRGGQGGGARPGGARLRARPGLGVADGRAMRSGGRPTSWPRRATRSPAYLAGTRDDPGDWPGLAVFAARARLSPPATPSILLAFEAAAEAAARPPRRAADDAG